MLVGIEPLTPLKFSVVAGLMAFLGWQITFYMSGHFAVDFLNSEFYPVQRVAIVARNLVVGIFTIGTAFSGIISLGLILLGITVGVGVAKGELDPKKINSPESEVKENDSYRSFSLFQSKQKKKKQS